jgi:hypothetical protein
MPFSPSISPTVEMLRGHKLATISRTGTMQSRPLLECPVPSLRATQSRSRMSAAKEQWQSPPCSPGSFCSCSPSLRTRRINGHLLPLQHSSKYHVWRTIRIHARSVCFAFDFMTLWEMDWRWALETCPGSSVAPQLFKRVLKAHTNLCIRGLPSSK